MARPERFELPTTKFVDRHLHRKVLKKEHYYNQDDPYKCIIMAMYVMFSRARTFMVIFNLIGKNYGKAWSYYSECFGHTLD